MFVERVEFVQSMRCCLDSGVGEVHSDGYCCIERVVVWCLGGRVHVSSVVRWVL